MNNISKLVCYIANNQEILKRDVSKDSEYSIFNCHNCGTDRVKDYFRYCDQCGINLISVNEGVDQ